MNDVFDTLSSLFDRPEEELAIQYCNDATENIDDEHVFDWCAERILYTDVQRREGANIMPFLERFPYTDRILFISAVSKVVGTYWLANGGVPADSRNLAAKMNY